MPVAIDIVQCAMAPPTLNTAKACGWRPCAFRATLTVPSRSSCPGVAASGMHQPELRQDRIESLITTKPSITFTRRPKNAATTSTCAPGAETTYLSKDIRIASYALIQSAPAANRNHARSFRDSAALRHHGRRMFRELPLLGTGRS